MEISQCCDLLLDLAGFAADGRFQGITAADTRPPRLKNARHVLQGNLHGLEGADQGQLGEHLLPEQAVPSGAAADRLDQALVAVKANGLDGEARDEARAT